VSVWACHCSKGSPSAVPPLEFMQWEQVEAQLWSDLSFCRRRGHWPILSKSAYLWVQSQRLPALTVHSAQIWSILAEANSEKEQRRGEERRGEGNRGVADIKATYKHSWLHFCFTTLLPLCIQLYGTDTGVSVGVAEKLKEKLWVKLPQTGENAAPKTS